ncbi:MAG: peptide-methionine (S)-S-oxide reductase MsrA [Thermoprotei archaeon]
MSRVDSSSKDELETATFGGGCFWCTEAVFSRLRGVVSVESGYSGGYVPNPTYEDVCSGLTGHAEVVQLKFNPKQVTYEDLLEVFFAIHDPTTPNRQGYDVGTQYRSVIFYHNEAQRIMAAEYIQKLSTQGVFRRPIVTQLEPFKAFYKAEDYHQEYYERNPHKPYCVIIISPKLSKLKEKFPQLLKE